MITDWEDDEPAGEVGWSVEYYYDYDYDVTWHEERFGLGLEK